MMFPSRTMPTRRHTLFTILALFIDYRYGLKVLSGEDFLPTIGRRSPDRADAGRSAASRKSACVVAAAHCRRAALRS